jgi:signal transduction histidine kinase
LVGAAGESALVDAGILHMPYLISWSFLVVLVAMAHELNTDVLAASQLARHLQESERRVDLASEAARIGMWAWDVTHDTIWATTRARVLLGLSEIESIDTGRFLDVLRPARSDGAPDTVSGILTADRGFDLESGVALPDGRTRWIASRGQVERDRSGKPIIVRGVVLDVSHDHSAEMELQELRNELRHAGRVSMMGQLASALAHELSQPLGAILRNTEAAELFIRHDPPNLDELRVILTDIRQDDLRAGGVIERLRSLLKRRTFTPRALPVGDLLKTIGDLTRTEASSRGTRLEFEAPGALPAVMGDPVHLQQVLLNLVLNAMDAVDGLPAERRTVTVRATLNGGREVEVAVSDAGRGIAPEQLRHVFDPFFTTKASGLGVGLSISRTIIEAHGGRIWADVDRRDGATFRFTLPLADGARSG